MADLADDLFHATVERLAKVGVWNSRIGVVQHQTVELEDKKKRFFKFYLFEKILDLKNLIKNENLIQNVLVDILNYYEKVSIRLGLNPSLLLPQHTTLTIQPYGVLLG